MPTPSVSPEPHFVKSKPWVAPPFCYTYLPGETPYVLVYGKVGAKAAVRVYPIQIEQWLEGRYDTSEITPVVSRSVELPKPKPEDKLPVLDPDNQKNRPQGYTPTPQAYYRASQGIALPPLKPGAYVVQVKGAKTVGERNKQSRTADSKKPEVSEILLIVTRIGLMVQTTRPQTMVRVVDLNSGEPVANAQLTFQEGEKQSAGITNKEGVFSQPKGIQASAGILARQGDSVAFLYQSGMPDYGFEGLVETLIYFQTDRPLYRPGQTVQFKGVLRKRTEDGYAVLAGKTIKITINTPDGKVVTLSERKTNEFGSFVGEYPVSDSAPLGAYTVQIGTEDPNQPLQNERFTVAKFRKPEYMVSVTPDSPVTVAGENFSAEISAQYYFGAPVTGATVQYQIYARPDYWWWWRESPEAGKLLADFPGVNEEGIPQFRYRYSSFGGFGRLGRFGYSGQGQMVANGTAITDSNGKVKVTHPATFNIAQWSYLGRLDYVVECTVMDSSRQQVAGSGQGSVVPCAVTLNLRQDKWGVKSGEEAVVHIETQLAREKQGKAHPVTVKVVRYSSWRAIIRNKGEKTQYTEWRQDSKEVESKTITTDTNGKGKFTFTPTQAGSYTVEATVTDSKERKAISSASFWVYDDKNLTANRPQMMTMQADKKRYYPGETATLLVQTPTKTADLWVTIAGRKKTESRRVRITNYATTLRIPLQEGDAPNMQVAASYVQNKLLYYVAQTVLVSPVKNLLNVVVTPKKAEYKPGETAEYLVRTTDQSGKPVSAEVAMAVTDASLLSLTEDSTAEIQPFFWSPLYIPIHMTFSVSPLPVGNPKGTLHTEWHDQYQYGSVFPTANLNGFGYPGNSVAGAVGGFGTGGIGGGFGGGGVASFRSVPASKMADMAAAPAPSFFAMKSEGKETGAEGVAIRSDFRDSAYWSPSVVTDGSGTATVSVPLPDNLTTWKAIARAITTTTRVGVGSGEVTTTLPMIARLEMPRFATQGDILTVSGVVHNYTNQPLTTRVMLSAKGPGLAVEGGGAIRTVTIAPKAEKRVDWTARGVQFGVTELTLTADGDVAKDGMVLPLPTLPYGSTATVASSGLLAEAGLTKTFTLPEGYTGFRDDLRIMVAPSLLSVALGGAADIAKYPYGCIEQTLSKFVPNLVLEKLLKERNLKHPQSDELPKMAATGLERVALLQLEDGGWGFGQTADPYFTATAVESLLLAKSCGYDVDNEMLSRGINALRQSTESLKVDGDAQNDAIGWNLQRKARALYVLSLVQPELTIRAVTTLWGRRDELETPALSLLIRAGANLKQSEITQEGLEILRKRAIKTAIGVYWKQNKSYYIERDTLATAEAVRALLAVNKTDPLIKDAFRYLIAQRQGRSWYTTNDTAAILYAAADYERAFPTNADSLFGATVIVNGETIETIRFTDRDLFQPERVITLSPASLKPGKNEVSLMPLDKGDNPVFYSVGLRYFLPRPPNSVIEPVVEGIRVERMYLKRVPKKPLDLKQNPGYYWRDENWELVPIGKQAQPGDEILVKLVVTSDSPVGYVVIEDFLPAGCEPADQIDADGSDTEYGNGRYGWWGGWGRRETHDERIAFLGERLPRGQTVLTYRVRVVTPGEFNAPPAHAFAMYLPEVRGSAKSDTFKVVE
jgi:hypothetical protein